VEEVEKRCLGKTASTQWQGGKKKNKKPIKGIRKSGEKHSNETWKGVGPNMNPHCAQFKNFLGTKIEISKGRKECSEFSESWKRKAKRLMHHQEGVSEEDPSSGGDVCLEKRPRKILTRFTGTRKKGAWKYMNRLKKGSARLSSQEEGECLFRKDQGGKVLRRGGHARPYWIDGMRGEAIGKKEPIAQTDSRNRRNVVKKKHIPL